MHIRVRNAKDVASLCTFREQLCRVALRGKKIPTGLIGPTAESAGKRKRGRKSSAFDLILSSALANASAFIQLITVVQLIQYLLQI